jgi:isovaleryl-CoA dehydrogenase
VEPQAIEFNKNEQLNLDLLRQLENLVLLGLTVKEEYSSSEMDATAVVLVHEELSYSDPAFCLSYLAHSLLLVNNLHVSASDKQTKTIVTPSLF